MIEIIKFVLGAAIPILMKKLFDSVGGGRAHSRLLKDYKFIAEFMSGKGIDDKAPIVVEQGFYTFFRKRFSYEVIKYLLKFPNPTRAFLLYDRGKHYLNIKNGTIYFEEKYILSKKREWVISRRYGTAYILIMIFLYSLIYHSKLISFLNGNSTLYQQLLIGTFIFAIVGVMQFWEAFALQCAQRLMAEQEKLEGYKS